MASRMDRYPKNELVTSNRSIKNKNLYDQIKDLDSYSNIEGVATIDNVNEIDISKVQEMLKNRENYKKQREYTRLLKNDIKEKKEEEHPKEEKKSYDLNDLLSLAKSDSKLDKYRSLDKNQYEELKKLSKKSKKFDIEKEEEELKELINTITSLKALNELSSDDDVGLLDDLKSDTVVGDARSIKKIMEEEKTKVQENESLDKSFYTSSFGFTSKDFNELKDINHKIKKSNKYIIILLIFVILLIIAVMSFFILM